MKLRAVVVEDDPVASFALNKLAAQIPDLEIIDSLSAGQQLLPLLSEHEVDLLLLDIEMPDINGLELLNTLSQRPLVIVTTSYTEYAVQCYDYDVVDFILKPVSLSRLRKAIYKAREWTGRRQHYSTVEEHLFIRQENAFHRIRLQDIRWVEAQGDISKFYTEGGAFVVSMRLKDIENQLRGSTVQRVHRSYLVNVNKISSFEDNLLITGKKLIPVGNKYRHQLFNRLKFLR